MTVLSVHPARSCPCGGGLVLPLGPGSGGGSARLVATREPLYAVESSCLDYSRVADLPLAAPGSAACWACGTADAPTHVVVCLEGVPCGADTLGSLAAGGLYDRIGREIGPGGN